MPARYLEISAKSIARPAGTVDPWFLGRFGLNLYRGCEHACAYCEGRAERYRVPGDFSTDIQVKTNAPEVLERELRGVREPGFVLLGGGVCDAYQPAEAVHRLARRALELVLARGLSVHVLTKSALVERDLDLLGAINAKGQAILSFSLNGTDERLRAQYEPGASPFAERLRLIRRAKELGLGTGVMAMPLLPGLSDQPAAVADLLRSVREAGADFVCLGGMTVRPGIHKRTYFAAIERHHPELVAGYQRLYAEHRSSGSPDARYSVRLEERCRAALATSGLPGRIPWRLFHGKLPLYAELGVLLEHRGFEQGERGWSGGRLTRAGMAIQLWAHQRLGRTRSHAAYREVESELVWLSRMGTLTESLGIEPALGGTVGEILEQVVATGVARPECSPFLGSEATSPPVSVKGVR
ncbi:MAG: radical SAM protein [Polyangiaceae bacterium]|nr:radical SAM protein [Polyangiaceae bacterium]